jgi:hypothetical protein
VLSPFLVDYYVVVYCDIIRIYIIFIFQSDCNDNTFTVLVVLYSCHVWYKYYHMCNDRFTLAFIIGCIFIRSSDVLAMF